MGVDIASGFTGADRPPYQDRDEPPDDLPPDPDEVETRPWTTGGSFVLDQVDDDSATIWGAGTERLWASGEALMICGPQGVGKSTIVQQVVRARLGLGDPNVLGYPVTPGQGRVLYLACDRPRQIARSMARMFTPEDRDVLDQRLAVHEGPPPFDFAKHTHTMTVMAQRAGADTVIVDSLKDVAIGLSDDEVGAGYNRARGHAIAAGIEVVEAHHQVKRAGNGSGKPNTLSDVYGSTWITSGAGSVLGLWGSAGDPIVELNHLKPSLDPVGPFRLIHDHDAGTTQLWHATDLIALARARPAGLTARAAAAALWHTDKPGPAEVEKARRRLEAEVRKNRLTKLTGDQASGTADAYIPAEQLPIGATL